MKQIIFLAVPPLVTDPLSGQSFLPAGYVDLGGGYYDIADNINAPSPLSSGATRYEDLAPAHKQNVMLSEAYRSKDGTDLKARILQAVKDELATQGKTVADFTAAQIKARVIKKLKDRIADLSETKAERVRVKMSAVTSKDIEETAGIPPNLWFGE